MTTLSSHSRLSTSLTPANGRCVDLSSPCENKRGTAPESAGNESNDLVLVDEEIASVEADGNPGRGVADGGGPAEKQLLTVALVTSIVEFAGTSPHGGSSTDGNNTGYVSGTNCVGMETRRRSVRIRQPSEGVNQGEQDAIKFPLPKKTSSFSHVTPPTSSSSSLSSAFSSVESTTKTLRICANMNQSLKSFASKPNRISKLVTSAKVASVSTSHTQTNAKVVKGNLNLDDAASSLSLNVGPFPNQATEPYPRLPTSHSPLRRMAATGEVVRKPLPIFNSQATILTAAGKSRGSARHDSMNPTGKKSGEGTTLRAKSGLSPSPLPIDRRELTLHPSSVPNPLAGTQGNAINVHSFFFPSASFKSKTETKKNSTIMSSTPNVLVPDSYPSYRNGSAAELGGQLANIAESMSLQNYQADGRAASNVSEVAPQERGRILSIDLDPAVLDFVENVVDPLSDGKTDISIIESPRDNCNTLCVKNPPDALRGVDISSGRVPLNRDRGFSFEFFSFGINEDEPPPPVSACGTHVSQGNRLRGDSIIFDPTSFREGGIHETSALLHIKQENEGCNNEAIPSALVESFSIPMNQAIMSGNSPMDTALCPMFAPKESAPVGVRILTKVVNMASHPKLHVKAKYVQGPFHGELSRSRATSAPEVPSTVSSRIIPQAFSDDTIHMPHGSDAAAAAAAGRPQAAPSMPNDGFSLSHTACPMELLNKCGRIGIYLPEERKARIAKFHSKRKIRIWRKRIKYDCRKKLADSRPRIKGRFVKRSDVDGEVSSQTVGRKE